MKRQGKEKKVNNFFANIFVGTMSKWVIVFHSILIAMALLIVLILFAEAPERERRSLKDQARRKNEYRAQVIKAHKEKVQTVKREKAALKRWRKEAFAPPRFEP